MRRWTLNEYTGRMETDRHPLHRAKAQSLIIGWETGHGCVQLDEEKSMMIHRRLSHRHPWIIHLMVMCL
jgi:hypothetical protein